MNQLGPFSHPGGVTPKEIDPARPDDIRAQGWSVAVHNDYRLGGQSHTFWLFTRGNQCVKGEGTSDAQALAVVRAEIAKLQAVSHSEVRKMFQNVHSIARVLPKPLETQVAPKAVFAFDLANHEKS